MRQLSQYQQQQLNAIAAKAASREKFSQKAKSIFKNTTTITAKVFMTPVSFILNSPRLLDTNQAIRTGLDEGWELGKKPFVKLEDKVHTRELEELEFIETAKSGRFTDYQFKDESSLKAGLSKLGVTSKDIQEFFIKESQEEITPVLKQKTA